MVLVPLLPLNQECTKSTLVSPVNGLDPRILLKIHMDLCTFSVVSVGGKEGLAGQTLDSFTSCIVGSSRTTYCLTTPTTLDHSPAPRMFNQFQWSLGADAEVSARSGPSAATSSSCSAGGRSGAPAPRPLLRIQLSASESGLDAALFMAFELFATLPSARLVAAWGAAWALGRERTGFLESTTSSPEHR